MPPCFEVQKQEKAVSGKKVAQCFWLFYKQLHFYISLLFHPMMNSINLDLFKASVGETTIFVVVTAVHSGAECFLVEASKLNLENPKHRVSFSNPSKRQWNPNCS